MARPPGHAAPTAAPTLPPSVRRRLAESGQSLTMDEWRRLPAAARRRLQVLPTETGTDRRTFATLLHWLRYTFAGPGVDRGHKPLPLEGRWPWREDRPPASLAGVLGQGRLDWKALDTDTRFELVEAAEGPDAVRLGRLADALRGDAPPGVSVA